MYYNEVEYTISVKIDGIKVHQYVESINLDFSDENYVNSVTINFTSEIDSVSAINLFSTLCDPKINWGQERITITINGVDYRFLLEKRNSKVTTGGRSFSIWGRSKAATLDLPYSEPFIDAEDAAYIWQTSNTMASQIVANLLAGSDMTCDFEIDDFPVYSDNFTVLNMTPISIINKLVNVPGGRLRSKPDGNLIADYKNYIIPADSTAVQLFTELDELVQVDETIERPIGYNKVEVIGYGSGSTEANKTLLIQLDENEDCLQSNVPFNIKVYASPLGVDYTFNSTRGVFFHLGTYGEVLTEEVIFTDGKSNTSKPIYSILSTEWVGKSLGSITHQQGYSGLTSDGNDGFGVLSITYVAQYDFYNVRITEPGTSLLYTIEDIFTEYDLDGNPIVEEV